MIKSLSPYVAPSYDGKKIFTRLLPSALLLVLHTYNNTDSNKFMIFSSIALYYGDTYTIQDNCYSPDNYRKLVVSTVKLVC